MIKENEGEKKKKMIEKGREKVSMDSLYFREDHTTAQWPFRQDNICASFIFQFLCQIFLT